MITNDFLKHTNKLLSLQLQLMFALGAAVSFWLIVIITAISGSYIAGEPIAIPLLLLLGFSLVRTTTLLMPSWQSVPRATLRKYVMFALLPGFVAGNAFTLIPLLSTHFSGDPTVQSLTLAVNAVAVVAMTTIYWWVGREPIQATIVADMFP